MKASDYKAGLLLVTGSAFAFSLAGLFTRLIHLDTWTMIAWRGIFSAVGIAVGILAMERANSWRKFRSLGLPGWLYAILGAVCMILYIAALRLTTVAHVAVIYATVPFFAALLGWFLLRESPSGGAVLASLAALGGVALMMGFGSGDLAGDALALLMTVGMAAIIVVARRFRDIPVMPAAGVSALLSGLVCCPFAHFAALTASDVSLLISFGVLNSALGLVLFMLGAQLLPPMETAFIGSLDAPLSPIWVWLVFAETPSTATISGGLVVFFAVVAYLAVSALRPAVSTLRTDLVGSRETLLD